MESLKALLKSTTTSKQLWENEEKPQLLRTVQRARNDFIEARSDLLRMEEARDQLALELRRVQGALDHVDHQRDDCQSTLDEVSIRLATKERETEQFQQENARVETALALLEKKNQQLEIMLAQKQQEISRARLTLERMHDRTQSTESVADLQRTESESLRKDLRAMTMENQGVFFFSSSFFFFEVGITNILLLRFPAQLKFILF